MGLKTILIVIRVGSVEDETGKVIVPQGSNVLFENAETFEIKGNTIIEKELPLK